MLVFCFKIIYKMFFFENGHSHFFMNHENMFCNDSIPEQKVLESDRCTFFQHFKWCEQRILKMFSISMKALKYLKEKFDLVIEPKHSWIWFSAEFERRYCRQNRVVYCDKVNHLRQKTVPPNVLEIWIHWSKSFQNNVHNEIYSNKCIQRYCHGSQSYFIGPNAIVCFLSQIFRSFFLDVLINIVLCTHAFRIQYA